MTSPRPTYRLPLPFPVADRITWMLMLIALFTCDWTGSHRIHADTTVARRPNLVFIMIDDLGWMDLACQGNRLVETPNIDRLASQGVRFTDNYAAAPVCSPTRAAIMTGKAPARLHITNHLPDQKRFTPDSPPLLPASCRDHLPLEEITLAERLQQAGYATGFIGKWHLSPRNGQQFEPQHQGFQLNLGGCSFGGPPTFFDPYRIPTLPDRRVGEYLPDRLADESIKFIHQHRDRPFFLCLWNYTVHWPMEAPQHLLDKYADRTGPGLNDTRYGAMIEAMDAAIGRILDAIDAAKLRDDTLVIFTSDNGAFGGVGDNRPLRAEKGYLYEGGIRVPLIIRWPGHAPAGEQSAVPTISMDFFPTLLQAAGADLQPHDTRDGTSLLPLLAERNTDQDASPQSTALRDRALYFHYPNYAFHRGNRLGGAVRQGRFKLIENYDDNSLELYDLQMDLGETNNLVDAQPQLAKRMSRQLHRWLDDTGAAMPQPVPPRQTQAPP